MSSPNIEKFNQLTAAVLAKLYQEFPIPYTLAYQDESLRDAGCFGEDDAPFFMATLRWLIAAGYITAEQENCVLVWNVILTPKGLETLCAIPDSLTTSLGERLKAAALSGSQAAAADAVKWVLAAGARYLL